VQICQKILTTNDLQAFLVRSKDPLEAISKRDYFGCAGVKFTLQCRASMR